MKGPVGLLLVLVFLLSFALAPFPARPMPLVKAQAPTPSLVTDLAALGYYQPDGMAVDKNGNIYVALDASAAIVEIHQDGTVEKLIDTANNVGLAIDQAGNLYYASFWGGTIQELPSGCRDASCVVTLWTAGDPLWNGGLPRGVGVDSAGRVFFTTRPAPGMDEANGTLSVRFVNGTAKVLLYNQDHPNLLSVGPDDCAYWGDSPYLTTNIAEAKRFCLGDTTYEILWQDAPGASTIYQVRRDPADPNTIYFTKDGDGTLLMLNRTKSQIPIRLVDEGTGTGCSLSDVVFNRNRSLLYFDNYLAFQGTCSASTPSSAPSGILQSNQVATTTYTMSSTEGGLKQSSEVAATNTETLSADSIYAVPLGQTNVLTTGVDSGSGSVNPNCPSPSFCSETVGQSVTVTASPSSGWQFSSWSTQSGISCGSNNPCQFPMPNNTVSLKAAFIQMTGVGGTGSIVVGASAGSVWFVLPDYRGPMHTPAAKCGGINSAELSDFSAGGYVLGSLSNPQNQLLDTNPAINMSTCGNPSGTGGTVVTLAGPGVNTVVHYYEQVARTTPVYYLWDGSKNNFVVRSTGVRYTVPNAGSMTKAGDDLFLIEAFTDGQGRRVLVLYGFSWQGTLAAGVFYASYVYPQLSQFPNSWYIYRWTDVDGNTFPDPGDSYTLLASSGPAPVLTSPSAPASGGSYSGFAGIQQDVLGASKDSVVFILPDYVGPMHSPKTKCNGRSAAALSDYSAGGYLLSATSNFQTQMLDTSSSVILSSGSCGQFSGSGSVLVGMAGPGVNTVVYYYEQISATAPVYFLWDGSKNNFVARSTGVRYTVPNAGKMTTSGDDLFVLEGFVDGQGRHVYVVYGFSWQGTLAAATFLNTYVRFHLSEFTNSWYIYEWKDASSGPSANTFPDQGDYYIQQGTG